MKVFQSMTHKILARAANLESVKSGQNITANIDMCFTHDPVLKELAELFYSEFGTDAKVWDPNRIALFQDHLVPAKDHSSRNFGMCMDKFAKDQNIKHYYPYGKNYGVCHTVMCEQGHVLPGKVIVGTDSHSVTYGALNAFGTGVGIIDMLNIFYTGKLWFRVPHVLQVNVEGELKKHVSAKDLILTLLRDIRMDGASNMAIEFTGSTIANMSAEERITLCNMGVEAGAKNAIMSLSPNARKYLESATNSNTFDDVITDPEFVYDITVSYRAEDIVPMVAHPHMPDNVFTLKQTESEKIKVDQIYIGSCTGGKLTDIEMVAEILKDRKIADNTRLIIVPASMNIYKNIAESGLMIELLKTGAVVESPGCKACYGAHGGVIGDGEVCLSTTNRNFKGRMGNPNSQIFLSSPYTAAKSALTGYITQ